MELYLVRHGQRYFGKRYDELQPVGIEQSKKVGEFLKDKKIDLVYYSPQERAKETFSYIKPFLDNNIEVIVTEELRQQGIPEEVGEGVINEKIIKLETNEQTRERAKRFLNFLLKNHKNESVLLVTHKRFCMFTVSNLLNKDDAEIEIHSASITYFELYDTNKIKNYEIAKIVY